MGGTRVGPQARREYLERMRERYHRAPRPTRGRLLDEVCEMTGYHRKAAIRLLRRGRCWAARAPPGPAETRRARGRHGAARDLDGRRVSEVGALEGAAAGLAAVGPSPVASDARDRGGLAPDQCAADGPALAGVQTAARHTDLRPHEAGDAAETSHPDPDRALDAAAAGLYRIDFVSHSGDCADGEFIHSLNLTDMHPTWVATRAVLGKGELRVQEALETMRQVLPFRLRGIDSDNGSEFINHHLYRYCQRKQIQFTRGRPYKKDDNAHIEQKNWTHVRKLVDYVRYDSPAALEALYADLRLFQNLWLPSVTLVKKTRVGSRCGDRTVPRRRPLTACGRARMRIRRRWSSWRGSTRCSTRLS